MKLEKAIELLQDPLLFSTHPLDPDKRDAISLGIEALKREKANRENPSFVMVGPLPGETEE